MTTILKYCPGAQVLLFGNPLQLRCKSSCQCSNLHQPYLNLRDCFRACKELFVVKFCFFFGLHMQRVIENTTVTKLEFGTKNDKLTSHLQLIRQFYITSVRENESDARLKCIHCVWLKVDYNYLGCITVPCDISSFEQVLGGY